MPIPYKNQTQKQKDKYKKSAAIWKEKNKEKVAAAKKAWCERNRAHSKEYDKAWRKHGANPPSKKIYDFETGTTKKVYE